MNYWEELQKIEETFLTLDNSVCDTLEEANNCLIKYDKLKDDIMLIVKQVVENHIVTEENIYREAIRILTSHIGSADDIQKYGEILESFYRENKLTDWQRQFFYENLDIGRWR